MPSSLLPLFHVNRNYLIQFFISICSGPLNGHPCIGVNHTRAVIIAPIFILTIVIRFISVTFIQRNSVLLHRGGGRLLLLDHFVLRDGMGVVDLGVVMCCHWGGGGVTGLRFNRNYFLNVIILVETLVRLSCGGCRGSRSRAFRWRNRITFRRISRAGNIFLGCSCFGLEDELSLEELFWVKPFTRRSSATARNELSSSWATLTSPKSKNS